MSSFIIHGNKRLMGSVEVSGSKNAALGVVAAAMLVDGPCILENVPEIADVMILVEICRDFGARIDLLGDNKMRIDPTMVSFRETCSDKTREIRASYYLLGALLGKLGEVRMNLPGGCNLGTRPIDQHIKGFAALGASVDAGGGEIHIKVDNGLNGSRIFLDVVSVGATINLILAATKANGLTIIENAAKEPHIVDVANFLNAMGANITGAGTDIIRIKGVKNLPGGAYYSVIPDQIEAGTYMIAAAATRGDVTVKNIIPKHMESLTVKLEEMGVRTEVGEDYCRIWTDENQALESTNFKTMPYPGFPTDLQPQTTVLLTTAVGSSRMHESVWATRFQYVDDLMLMGASISIQGNYAMIDGPSHLRGAKLRARDLRAGAAMVIAGLIASGETEIEDAHIVERGYENIEKKLSALGAEIWKA